MALVTQRVVLVITVDDNAVNTPEKWEWGEIISPSAGHDTFSVESIETIPLNPDHVEQLRETSNG
jgi:acyl-homoserine lactone acylase PvdQ